MIDVGALGPYPLEPTVYSERVRAYTSRLSTAPPPPPPPMPRLLKDVPQSERNLLLAKPSILAEDRELVSIILNHNNILLYQSLNIIVFNT